MGRMRSWNSSEYESCGLQPYEISKREKKRERREEEEEEEEEEDLFFMWRVEELLDEVYMSEGRTYGKGHWIGIEQVFIYFRIDLYVNKRREGGSFACGIKNGNKVFFRHAEDSATFVMTSC